MPCSPSVRDSLTELRPIAILSGVPSAHLVQMSNVASMFDDDGKGIVARGCPLVSDGAEDKVFDAARG
jgi:hypothetical protein